MGATLTPKLRKISSAAHAQITMSAVDRATEASVSMRPRLRSLRALAS